MIDWGDIIRKTAVLGALVAAFLVMASVFNPGSSRANEFQSRNGTDAAPGRFPSTDPHEGLHSLGVLHHGNLSIEIFAGAQGPLYSVTDQNDTLVATLRTAEQIERQFPGLPIQSLDADTPLPSLPIMRAQPDDGGL